MLPERLRGQETSEYLRLWPRWVHPYFKSYEEVEWSGSRSSRKREYCFYRGRVILVRQ